MTPQSDDALHRSLGEHYDRLTYSPLFTEYFGWGDFMNFGYWDGGTGSIHDAAVRLGRELLSFLPEKTGRILDVACGKGANTRLLLDHFAPHDVTGVNISEKQLETCRRSLPGCAFHLMDAVDLRFDDETFDHVLCVEAAFHFNTRETFLREACRVLKPGGRLVLSDILMTREAERRRQYRFEENFLEDPAAYEAALRAAGFDRLQVVDATRECWHGFYWHVVRFVHEKCLRRELAPETVKTYLETTYQRVPDLRYYLLAWAQKPLRSFSNGVTGDGVIRS